MQRSTHLEQLSAALFSLEIEFDYLCNNTHFHHHRLAHSIWEMHSCTHTRWPTFQFQYSSLTNRFLRNGITLQAFNQQQRIKHYSFWKNWDNFYQFERYNEYDPPRPKASDVVQFFHLQFSYAFIQSRTSVFDKFLVLGRCSPLLAT